jgi:hypothetical protein
MKAFKLLAVLGLVLAVSSTAWANLTIGGVSVPPGEAQFKLNNWDVGTIYHGMTAGTTYTGAALAALSKTGPAGGVGGEDSWGILNVTSIQDAVSPHTPYFTFSGVIGSRAVIAIFWGEKDASVTLNADGSQDIQGNGMNLAFYDKTIVAGAFPNILPAPGGSGAGFAGAGDPTDPTSIFFGLTPVLTFTSIPGFQASSTNQFFAHFDPSGNSSGGFYITPATVETLTGSENGDVSGLGTVAFTATTPGDNGWLLNSFDPVGVNVVPEPVTMFSAFMAICGLGGYIRRRMTVPV